MVPGRGCTSYVARRRFVPVVPVVEKNGEYSQAREVCDKLFEAYAGVTLSHARVEVLVSMVPLTAILDQVRSYHPAANTELINKAYVYSARAHDGQARKSAGFAFRI